MWTDLSRRSFLFSSVFGHLLQPFKRQLLKTYMYIIPLRKLKRRTISLLNNPFQGQISSRFVINWRLREGFIVYLLFICKIWTLNLFMNRKKVRFLNSKYTDLDWYYYRPYQKLKFLIRDLLFTTLVNTPPPSSDHLSLTCFYKTGKGWLHKNELFNWIHGVNKFVQNGHTCLNFPIYILLCSLTIAK